MDILRTPDERFANLPGYDYAPHYIDIPDGEGGTLRMHTVDEGPAGAPPVLLLHGEPSWSYLYRKMIPVITAAGYRAIAPDLVGFGRSDKPTAHDDHSYQRHIDWVATLIEAMDLDGITLFCQDWGGLIGLRVVAEHGERFDRVVAANTGLPTGEHQMPEAFQRWVQFSQSAPELHMGQIVNMGTTSSLADDVRDAYDAPFPDDSYKIGPRVMPSLVPTDPDSPDAQANRAAWEVLRTWQKPFLTAFSDSDPITSGGEAIFHANIPHAQQVTIEGAGHFLQEDAGEQVAQAILDFIEETA